MYYMYVFFWLTYFIVSRNKRGTQSAKEFKYDLT